MKKYEINTNTLAVVGIDDKMSKVFEGSKKYDIEDNSYQIMEDSCNYFGSSLKGRIAGTRKMVGINYKVPIIIEESNDLIFFPLSEVENSDCIWISLNWYDKVENSNGITYIIFKNGKKLPTKISKYKVENQVLRATKLNYLLNERKKIKKY